jgi:hypothetical protein
LFSISALVGQTTTIVATALPGSIGTSPTLTVPSNQVATVLRVFIPPDSDQLSGERYPFVNVRIGTNEFASPGSAPVTVAGPASIKITIDNTNPFFTTPASAYGTIRISDEQTQFTPSTAVVIPSDATGPVRIILESSADLLNWTDALPGTYGGATTNRFFRVRAVKL